MIRRYESASRARRARGRFGRVALAGVVTMGVGSIIGLMGQVPSGAASPHAISFGSPVWQSAVLPDGSNPIALSSPNVANLPGGPAVVVGDESGLVYSFNLATGARGWTYNAGAPVNSSPSVAAVTPGSALDSVFVGSGDAAVPTAGGYQAISPSGGDQWFAQETNPSTDPTTHNGVQASLAVGDLQGGNDVTAGSLGQNQDALNASNGALLTGFPWFQADSNFTTPALADLYSNGTTEIVEGGDSSAGVAYGQSYVNGGHLRILSPAGNAGAAQPNGGLDCEYDTNETVESSPAVGEFFGSSSTVGIVFGTGATYHTSETNQLIAVDSHCNLAWSATLNGNTKSSPALADVLGNGQLQVVEGTDNGSTGSVYALNGANRRGPVADTDEPGNRLGRHGRPRFGLSGRPGADDQRCGGARRQNGGDHHDPAARHRVSELAPRHRRSQRNHRDHVGGLPGGWQRRVPLRNRGLEGIGRQRGGGVAAVPPRPAADG